MSKLGYIQRYLLIIRTVKRHRYISMDELVRAVESELSYYEGGDHVGVSRRTVQRDLKDIRNSLGISIDYSKTHNGYCIPEDEDQISDIERILEPFDLLGTMYADNRLPDFIFTEKRKPKGTEHLSRLIYALKNRLITKFYYQKYDGSLSHVRKVEPYALREFKDRWYLLAVEIDGHPEERGLIKTWGLDRIRELSVTTTKFQQNFSLNIEDEFRDVFGIYSDRDRPAEEVILSFDAMGGKYNDSFPLHSSQKTLIDNDDEFRIRLKVKVTTDFIMELLSQSENMRVVSPNHLKESLIKLHKDAIKLLQTVDDQKTNH